MRVTSNEKEIERLLEIVDPYNNQQVTFSECLSLFSSVRYYIKVGNRYNRDN